MQLARGFESASYLYLRVALGVPGPVELPCRAWEVDDAAAVARLCARADHGTAEVRAFAPHGTLDEWQEDIATLVTNPGCGRFLPCASFAIWAASHAGWMGPSSQPRSVLKPRTSRRSPSFPTRAAAAGAARCDLGDGKRSLGRISGNDAARRGHERASGRALRRFGFTHRPRRSSSPDGARRASCDGWRWRWWERRRKRSSSQKPEARS